MMGRVPPINGKPRARDDGIVRVKPLLDRAPHFADLFEDEADAAPSSACEEATGSDGRSVRRA